LEEQDYFSRKKGPSKLKKVEVKRGGGGGGGRDIHKLN
jgi:hypothetical protein